MSNDKNLGSLSELRDSVYKFIFMVLTTTSDDLVAVANKYADQLMGIVSNFQKDIVEASIENSSIVEDLKAAHSLLKSIATPIRQKLWCEAYLSAASLISMSEEQAISKADRIVSAFDKRMLK